MHSDLISKHCESCEGLGSAFSAQQTAELMPELSAGWHLAQAGQAIRRSFMFKDFYETIAFVNAIAWIANTENHHPELEVGYSYCNVQLSTHALNGLSKNDFICAAKIDNLLPKVDQ
jgi:4a-hydroxytetrahydrobiopterin dehydratase